MDPSLTIDENVFFFSNRNLIINFSEINSNASVSTPKVKLFVFFVDQRFLCKYLLFGWCRKSDGQGD